MDVLKIIGLSLLLVAFMAPVPFIYAETQEMAQWTYEDETFDNFEELYEVFGDEVVAKNADGDPVYEYEYVTDTAVKGITDPGEADRDIPLPAGHLDAPGFEGNVLIQALPFLYILAIGGIIGAIVKDPWADRR